MLGIGEREVQCVTNEELTGERSWDCGFRARSIIPGGARGTFLLETEAMAMGAGAGAWGKKR